MSLFEFTEALFFCFHSFLFGWQIDRHAHERIQPEFIDLIHFPGRDDRTAMHGVDDAGGSDRIEPDVLAVIAVRQPFQGGA